VHPLQDNQFLKQQVLWLRVCFSVRSKDTSLNNLLLAFFLLYSLSSDSLSIKHQCRLPHTISSSMVIINSEASTIITGILAPFSFFDNKKRCIIALWCYIHLPFFLICSNFLNTLFLQERHLCYFHIFIPTSLSENYVIIRLL